MTQDDKQRVSNFVVAMNNNLKVEYQLTIKWHNEPKRKRGVFFGDWCSLFTGSKELYCSDDRTETLQWLNGYLVGSMIGGFKGV